MFIKKEAGFSLLETMVSVTIIGVATLTIFMFLGSMARQTTNVKYQTFATQKAIQIMEELRSLVGRTDRIGILDNYDNGVNFSPFLTTEDTQSLGYDPSSPLSGNVRMGANWRFLRQISIIGESADPYMRKVRVSIYLADESNPSAGKTFLAKSVSIIKTSVAGCNPIQVMDVYFLCIENIPGWWTSTADLRPMADELVTDLQTRNPGLELRTHWITRLAYGRDPCYTPWINESVRADQLTDIPYVYYYPGLVKKRTSGGVDYSEFYYVPGYIGGKINIDGTVTNASSYSVADQYNNAVRYPDEERLYAQSGGEISLRMLLEKMNSSPSELRNVLIVNLHGELLPIPPMRNYSDPAKDPVSSPNARIVAHPEKLLFGLADQIPLRVYSYVMNPDGVAHDSVIANATIHFPNIRLQSSDITVEKCEGNSLTAYAWTSPCVEGVQYSLVSTGSASDGTTITLFNSPLRHPENGAPPKGLPSAKRLYGLEYIPSPMHPAVTPVTFQKDLTDAGDNAKNTARWRIIINAGVLAAGRYEADVRIGSQTSSDYPNISRTYFWVNLTPPYTEQFQFMGDPRHNPYIDVKLWGSAPNQENRYNWFFAGVPAGDYQGYTKTTSVDPSNQPGWCGGYSASKLNIDVPRFFQIYRRGLLFTNGVLTPISGWSFYYLGIGGEIGGDASNDMPKGLEVREKPWSKTDSLLVKGVNEITNYWGP